MTKEFLNVNEFSEYLGIKRSTLYSMVENGEIPHYKIGRLIRFKRDDVDAWLEGQRRTKNTAEEKAKDILGGLRNKRIDVDRIVKKSIEEVKGSSYNLGHGKPDQVKGLRRKEVSDGLI